MDGNRDSVLQTQRTEGNKSTETRGAESRGFYRYFYRFLQILQLFMGLTLSELNLNSYFLKFHVQSQEGCHYSAQD